MILTLSVFSAYSENCRPNGPTVAAVMLGIFACAAQGTAQPVFSPPPAAQLVPASMRQIKGAGSNSPAPAGVTSPKNTAPPVRSGGSSNKSPFSWGPFSVRPHFTESFMYSDGLQSQPGRPSNTYVNAFSPGGTIDFGKHLTADYTFTWTTYTSRAFRESLDHSVNVAGGLTLREWTATFSQGYISASAPLISTGRQTGQEIVSTTLGLARRISTKLSLSFSASQSLSFVNAAPDSYTWSGSGQLQYHVSSKLDLGTGVRVGYTDMDPGSNMAIVTPTAQVSWHPSEKLSVSATGGEQIQQSYSRGVPAKYTPVFGVSAQYTPFEHTSFALSASRTVTPSVLRNQVTDNTSWTARFSQRLLQHLNFGATYGEQDAGYVATNRRVTAGRKDKSYNYGFNLGTTFLRRGSVGLTYSASHNASNTDGFDFTSTQMGVTIGFRY